MMTASVGMQARVLTQEYGSFAEFTDLIFYVCFNFHVLGEIMATKCMLKRNGLPSTQAMCILSLLPLAYGVVVLPDIYANSGGVISKKILGVIRLFYRSHHFRLLEEIFLEYMFL
ncbi:hypothetical protein ACJX0J_025458 [Zea mays]